MFLTVGTCLLKPTLQQLHQVLHILLWCWKTEWTSLTYSGPQINRRDKSMLQQFEVNRKMFYNDKSTDTCFTPEELLFYPSIKNVIVAVRRQFTVTGSLGLELNSPSSFPVWIKYYVRVQFSVWEFWLTLQKKTHDEGLLLRKRKGELDVCA